MLGKTRWCGAPNAMEVLAWRWNGESERACIEAVVTAIEAVVTARYARAQAHISCVLDLTSPPIFASFLFFPLFISSPLVLLLPLLAVQLPKPCFLCGVKGHEARDCINQQVAMTPSFCYCSARRAMPKASSTDPPSPSPLLLLPESSSSSSSSSAVLSLPSSWSSPL
eukprot:220395-Rhodomonas_salina.1